MSIHAIWLNANSDLEAPLRRANEARAAAFYAAWKATVRAVGDAARKTVEQVRRANRARRSYNELNALSDHQLRDIGVFRSEIASVADAVAAEPAGAGLTLADLRQVRSGGAGDGTSFADPRRHDDRGHRNAPPRVVVRPVGAAASGERAAA